MISRTLCRLAVYLIAAAGVCIYLASEWEARRGRGWFTVHEQGPT